MAPRENGWADFDDLYVKPRAVMLEDTLWGNNTINFSLRKLLLKTPSWGGDGDLPL
jgi:hypothetical protein